jgi:histidyl-tRNA synthetase
MIQAPRGMPDLSPNVLKQHQHLETLSETIARQFGYHAIETPIVEDEALFRRTTGSSDIVTKELFTLEPRSEEQENRYVLRPEGTAPVMRYLVSAKLAQDLPQNFFYKGPMFRAERPQKGRFRSFHQFGVERIGNVGPGGDLDALACAFAILKACGLAAQVRLEINSLGDSDARLRYVEDLKTFLSAHENNLSPDSQRRLHRNPLRILDSKAPQDRELIQKAPQLRAYLSSESEASFQEVCAHLDVLEIPYEINPYLVRGLDYYTETTFEFVSPQLGTTVLAGGHYLFSGETFGISQNLEGVGWAAGTERLLLLMEEEKHASPPLFLLPCEGADVPGALKVAEALRQQNIAISVLYPPQALGKRFKIAHKRGAAHVIVYGAEEAQKECLLVKDMALGTQQHQSLASFVAERERGDL